MNKNILKIVSLFSGIGGFEVGVKMSGIQHEIVLSSEIDKYAQKSYISIFGNNNLYGDIKMIDEKTVPDHNLLCAGFPCQTFSITGKREGFNDIRGTLFFDICRILEAKRPKYILLENVKNLISHDNSTTIKVILESLYNLDYTLDLSIINSAEAGIPQSRDRTYIFGILNGKEEPFEDDRRNNKITELKTFLNQTNFNGFNFFNSLYFKNKPKYIIDILESNVDEKYFITTKMINEYLKSLKIKINTNRDNKIIKLLDLPRDIHNDLDRQRRIYSIYGISPTLLARSDSTKILLEHHNKFEIRKFTPAENFLAQGFEKTFAVKLKQAGISDTQLYKQSGNAVSPPVIKQIMIHMKEGILNGKY